MDLTFSTEERAFENEVREFIAQNLTPEMKRAPALTPSVFSEPEIGMAWQKSAARKGLGRAGMADRTWRPRLDRGATLDLRGGMRPRRHAQCL